MRHSAVYKLSSALAILVSLIVPILAANSQETGQTAKAKTIAKAATKVKKPAKSQTAEGKVSDEQAVAKVMLLPEVKEFWQQGQLPANKKMGTAKIEVEPGDGDDKGNWIVHVYTLMSDHTATMGWYRVDRRTGAVSSMMP
ncbi:MAG: hypothetical protein K2X70_09935 [Candidatus Obscuribacterales bacterium]|jgi:hypothetical protein|nr:hypothetical protein [Candidatus Obscuribacterales bacterium]